MMLFRSIPWRKNEKIVEQCCVQLLNDLYTYSVLRSAPLSQTELKQINHPFTVILVKAGKERAAFHMCPYQDDVIKMLSSEKPPTPHPSPPTHTHFKYTVCRHPRYHANTPSL